MGVSNVMGGTPLYHPFIDRDFLSKKPSSYWGTPMAMETPISTSGPAAFLLLVLQLLLPLPAAFREERFGGAHIFHLTASDGMGSWTGKICSLQVYKGMHDTS
jgi:hypothetical protein